MILLHNVNISMYIHSAIIIAVVHRKVRNVLLLDISRSFFKVKEFNGLKRLSLLFALEVAERFEDVETNVNNEI